MEVLHEAEQARPKLIDTYVTYSRMMGTGNWDVDTIRQTVSRAVATGKWCPQVIGAAMFQLYYHYWNDVDRKTKLRAFFEECVAASPERHRKALFAAAFRDRRDPLTQIFDYGIEWPEMREGFLELERMFPDSLVNCELTAHFAACAGDRELTGRMFKRMDEFDWVIDSVWDPIDLQARRAWLQPDFAQGDQRVLLEYGPALPLSMRRLADGTFYVSDRDGRFGVLDSATGIFMPNKARLIVGMQRADVTPDGEAVAHFAYSGLAAVDNLTGSKRFAAVRLPNYGTIQRMAVSPDRSLLAIAGGRDKSLYVYDIKRPPSSSSRPADRKIDKATADTMRFLSFTDDQSIVGLDNRGTITIWKAADLTPVTSWKGHTKEDFHTGALSRDGRMLATYGRDKAVRVWSIPDGKKLAEFPNLKEHLGALAFSADGKFLVGGEGTRGIAACSLHLWSLETQTLVRSFQGHKGSVVSVDFAPDSRTIMSASLDLTIRIWDVP
jgi:hypothetical protein